MATRLEKTTSLKEAIAELRREYRSQYNSNHRRTAKETRAALHRYWDALILRHPEDFYTGKKLDDFQDHRDGLLSPILRALNDLP